MSNNPHHLLNISHAFYYLTQPRTGLRFKIFNFSFMAQALKQVCIERKQNEERIR